MSLTLFFDPIPYLSKLQNVLTPSRLALQISATHPDMTGHPHPRRRWSGWECLASHRSNFHAGDCQGMDKSCLKFGALYSNLSKISFREAFQKSFFLGIYPYWRSPSSPATLLGIGLILLFPTVSIGLCSETRFLGMGRPLPPKVLKFIKNAFFTASLTG